MFLCAVDLGFPLLPSTEALTPAAGVGTREARNNMRQSRTNDFTTKRTYSIIGSLTADHMRLTEDINFRADTATVELGRYLRQYSRDGAGMAGAAAGVDSSFTAIWAGF